MHYPRKSQRKCTKKSRTYPPLSLSFFMHSATAPPIGGCIDVRSPSPDGSGEGLRMLYLVGYKEVS